MIKDYMSNGHLLIPHFFDPSQIKNEARRLENIKSKNFTYEKNGSIRSLFAPHWYSEIIKDFVYDNPTTAIVKEILGCSIYVHQVHINYKKANTGGEFAWHSDYTFWEAHDGMPTDNAISVLFFLDDMTMDNGPLQLLEGSHRHYVKKVNQDEWTINHDSTETDGMITEELIYEKKFQNHIITGKAGDVLLMHANTWHTSERNKSNKDRNILFVCYNSIENKTTKTTRPNHIVLRDFSLV